ncbi:MAG: DUF1080 domain-containing protein [Bacteroidota bacterium]
MRFSLLFVFAFCLIACQPTAEDPNQEDWQALFNGQDLSGWIPKVRGYAVGENYGQTFRVADSLLQVRYDAYDTFNFRYGHLFYEQPYSYYRIRTQYRFVGKQASGGEGWAWRNSGIMVHGQSPESMALNQDFPISIEVQLLGGPEEGERPTANLCTPGTHVYMADTLFTQHCIGSESETYRGDQWVEAEVLVLGDSLIKHYINGKEVLAYTHPMVGGGVVNEFEPSVKKDGQILTSGSISLQSESHPIDFKKVELLNLEGCMDPKALNYRKHFIKHNGELCRYE